MQAPQELVDRYLEAGETLGAALTYAMIEVMDAGVGRIDETLRELGLADDTIVVFASDNGPYLGDVQGVSLDRYNHGWRGAKHYVFEGGIRVPAIVRWPDRLDGGTRRQRDGPLRRLAADARRGRAVPLPNRCRLDGDDIGPVLAGESGDVRPAALLAVQPLRASNRGERSDARRGLEARAAGDPAS